jgi:hypothetical protein
MKIWILNSQEKTASEAYMHMKRKIITVSLRNMAETGIFREMIRDIGRPCDDGNDNLSTEAPASLTKGEEEAKKTPDTYRLSAVCVSSANPFQSSPLAFASRPTAVSCMWTPSVLVLVWQASQQASNSGPQGQSHTCFPHSLIYE